MSRRATARRHRLSRCLPVRLWTLIWLAYTAGPAAAQAIDDLFETPDDVQSQQTEQPDQSAPTDQSEAQPDIDDLFGPDQTESDAITERDAVTDDSVDIGALTTAPTTVSGTVTTRGGFGAGLSEWPGTSAAAGRDIADLQSYSLLFASSASISVDSRPTSYLRFRSTLSSSLDETTLSYPTPEIDELFVDYTLGDSLFLRGGTFAVVWGSGRLLDNPANIVDTVADGVAVRASFPIGGTGVNALVYSNQGLAGTDGAQDWREFAFAGQIERGIGPLVFDLATDWAYERAPRTTAGATLAAGEATVSTDAVYRWDYADPFAVWGNWQALANVFWENRQRTWSVVAEYQYDELSSSGGTHQGALAFAAPSLGQSSWRPALRWRHAFEDRSGEVIPALSGTIAPSLSMGLTVPIVYGAPGSFYREALIEQSETAPGDEDDEVLIPIDNVVQVLVVVSLTFSF